MINNKDNGLSLIDILIALIKKIRFTVISIILFIIIFLINHFLFENDNYISNARILLTINDDYEENSIISQYPQFANSLPFDKLPDLSNGKLIPSIVSSKVFRSRLLNKVYYSSRYQKKLPLFSILTEKKMMINSKASLNYQNLVNLEQSGKIMILRVSAPEPQIAMSLAEDVIEEIINMNNLFKKENLKDHRQIIANRIDLIKQDLDNSELKLELFLKSNSQVNSPRLLSELNFIEGEINVQKNIYLALLNNLELINVELNQLENPIIILDPPSIPLEPSNKNITTATISGILFGIVISVFSTILPIFLRKLNITHQKYE